MAETIIAVDGGDVWADDSGGDGPPLVLLHPGVGDSRIWEPVLPALTASYRVIRYDARVQQDERRAVAPAVVAPAVVGPYVAAVDGDYRLSHESGLSHIGPAMSRGLRPGDGCPSHVARARLL